MGSHNVHDNKNVTAFRFVSNMLRHLVTAAELQNLSAELQNLSAQIQNLSLVCIWHAMIVVIRVALISKFEIVLPRAIKSVAEIIGQRIETLRIASCM